MATPSLVQIDDRDPLVFYSPNNSWTRGGATSDFDGTSTSTATTGASATLTFTGSGISVWGTIQLLQPNAPTFVVSSYRINNGPTTIFNATETAGYQFQQKLFQSARLNESVPHTLVVTLVNNGTFFIDYFLVVPVGVTSASASSSNPTALTTVSSADSSTTAGAGLQSHSRLSVGPVVGGTLGGVALLMIAILAVLLCWRRKDKDQKHYSQSQVDPFITSALSNQQHQPHEGSERVSEHQSLHPTLAPTSSSGVIPSSKAARLPNPSHRGDSLHSRQLSDSIEPPRYNE